MVPAAPIARLALCCVLALALTACGFQLRGSYRLPPELMPLAVEAPAGSNVARELRTTLRRQGEALAPSAEAAAARIVILEEQNDRRILSVGASATVNEYEVSKTVRWRLERRTDGEPEVVIPAAELTTRRDYRFDPTGVLSKAEEEATLYEEMESDLAQRILARMQSGSAGGS